MDKEGVNTGSLTSRIKARAHELGFSSVGIARAETLDIESARLRQWLAAGFHGTMEWMARGTERRRDSSEVVPGARSVIAVAMNYFTPHQHSGGDGAGKISRYAWGDDYHDLLTDRLSALWEWIRKNNPEASGRYYVDTGPVMDKVWAQRAGIGWIGKHTNVITQEHGSWVFLGEVITTLELEYDAPATDHCGTCRLCIDACPTDAIVDEYVVDSNKCLSYLTIEHRGDVSGEIARQFDGWIYGCDVCQDVCPWNHKFSHPTQEKAYQPREGNLHPPLESWKEMTQEEFSRRFKGSPIKRTKRDGLVRNIRIVLGDESTQI